MSFFSTHNLTEQAVVSCEPWSFTPVEKISAQTKFDKVSRQQWYQSTSTSHNFYTAVEACNPNARVSKQNPPRLLHGIVADYDLPLPLERIQEAVTKMKIPPTWMEKSLGGNWRLVWVFSKPIPLGSADFATFVLGAARQFFMLDLLPGLDAPALTDSARLFCNGCEWTQVSPQPVPELAVQSFFVQCGKKYAFKDTAEECAIPLDVVERSLAAKYPTFSWPGEFTVDSQGPSFFVEGSTSPTSALVKATGIFSFAAHADKPFYTWADLLGAEFAAQWQSDAIASATKEIYFDGRLYWKMNETEGCFVPMSKDALMIHFQVNCRVTDKKDKGGISPMARCLSHINDHNRAEGGAPLLFMPPGKTIFCGRAIINTAPRNSVVQPSGAADPQFPFLNELLDNIFDPPLQRVPFVSWLKFFYVSALEQKPNPGQNIFLAGGPNTGKTLMGRSVIGGLLGGFADASRFLVGGEKFNSSLFYSAVWNCDDENISSSESARQKFSSAIKLLAANQSHSYEKKYESSLMIPWSGRAVVTLNTDANSSRSLPALDGSLLDKISLFRCCEKAKMIFPTRDEIQKILKAELPNLAQYLVNFKIPDEWVGDSRYGVRSWQEPSLVTKAHQAGRGSSFKELLLEYLIRFFTDNPKAEQWKGSTTQVMRAVTSDPMNESIVRSLRMESVNRYLESFAREGVIDCVAENGPHKTRLWCFPRF